jgi:hypothetical protein
MAAYTNSQQAVEAVLLRIEPRPPEDVLVRLRARLSSRIGTALERLAKRVAAGGDFRGMQKPFPVTIAAGVADLGQAGLERLLFDVLRAVVFAPDGSLCVYAESRHTLLYGGLPNDTIYFTAEGSKLIFLNTDNSIITLAGVGSCVGNFIPADVTEVDDTYKGALIDTMLEDVLSSPDVVKKTMDARELANQGGS